MPDSDNHKDNNMWCNLVEHHYTLVERLQNLLPARSHNIRSHLDSTIFAVNLRTHVVLEREVKSAVDFTWGMLRMAGASNMDRSFEAAYASIMNTSGNERIRLFLNHAHKQLDMIQHTANTRGLWR